jgi:hypothetical protein
LDAGNVRQYHHNVHSYRASCVVQSLPTAAPSILRRLFAKLRLAQDSAASRSTDPVSVPTAPPRSSLSETQPLSAVPLRSGPPAEPKSAPTTAHPSISFEADNNPDDVETLLKSAIEMARGSLRLSQLPTDHTARTPAGLTSSMRAKSLRTSRIVQIQRDPQETAYFARDTKSGLVVMRHEDSKRLKELCEWFGWQVIDGGMPDAGD